MELVFVDLSHPDRDVYQRVPVAAAGLEQQYRYVGVFRQAAGERELRDSLGNVLTTKKVQVPTLRVGSCELEDVPAEFFSGAIGRQKMSVFGCNLLTRFSVFLDVRRGRLYLRPLHAS